MVPSEVHLADGVSSLLEFFEWRRLVVLTESLPIFRSVSGWVLGEEGKGGIKQGGIKHNATHKLI